jgi:hypothetical protein
VCFKYMDVHVFYIFIPSQSRQFNYGHTQKAKKTQCNLKRLRYHTQVEEQAKFPFVERLYPFRPASRKKF